MSGIADAELLSRCFFSIFFLLKGWVLNTFLYFFLIGRLCSKVFYKVRILDVIYQIALHTIIVVRL